MLLLHFLECVQDKKLPNRWDPNPGRKVQKLENLSIAVNYITNVMNVKLVGIGAEGKSIHKGYRSLRGHLHFHRHLRGPQEIDFGFDLEFISCSPHDEAHAGSG